MISYIIHSVKEITSIIEVKCEKVLAIDKEYSPWLKENEYKVRILAPQMLLEKQKDNSYKPSVYMSWALYDTADKALEQAKLDLEVSIKRTASKKGQLYNEADYQEAISKIEIIKL